MLQALLGNIGRPGGGVLALRGHASIQGSTDIATLYHSLPGYLNMPDARRHHDTLKDFILTEAVPLSTSYWGNYPKFAVSYFKAQFGDAATKDNDYGYDYHPKITGDHSHLPMFVDMMDGKIKGFLCVGQNPAVGGQNARFQRKALAKLDWMVVRDFYETETAAFWRNSPEIKSGELKTADIKTEIFFLPSACVPEMEGSFTNTQRLLQYHEKAADPPGRCAQQPLVHLSSRQESSRSFTRIRPTTATGRSETCSGITSLNLPKSHRGASRTSPRHTRCSRRSTATPGATKSRCPRLPTLRKTARPPAAPGSTPASSRRKARTMRRDARATTGSRPNWGFAWPANRHIMYNRASADLEGKPWSEKKKLVYWDPTLTAVQGCNGNRSRQMGLAFGRGHRLCADKSAGLRGKDNGIGFDWLGGNDPFIMRPDGKAWLFAPFGLVDGPLPTHYEPYESPVHNIVYKQQSNPVAKVWKVAGNPYHKVADPEYPIVISTYRLTEHYLSGTMSRWLPWLAELMPELFCEISPELASKRASRTAST